MEFKLRPFSKNLFPKGALLLCDASPRIWLQEIQRMGFGLKDVSVFPVPSSVANELYGCLLVFKNIPKGIDVGRNLFFQNVNNKLFIPENTLVTPMVSMLEMEQLFAEQYHVFHNDFGLVALDEEVDWMTVLTDATEVSCTVVVPAKSVTLPKSITSLRIEIDEEALLKALEVPVTEEAFLENLPFDMKKVLRGNQREIDKFLAYLDKNPEMALQLGIPLDVMHTSRGDQSGSFSFRGNGSGWFDLSKFFKGGTSGSFSGSGGGLFSGSLPSFGSMGSDGFARARKAFFRIVWVVFMLSMFFSGASILYFFKWLLVLGAAAGVIYFIIKLTSGDSSGHEIRKVSQHTTSKNNYSSTNRSMDRYFPAVVLVVIVVMSIMFVKFIASDFVDRSISPLPYLIGFFILVIVVVFLLLSLMNALGNAGWSGTRSGGTSGNAALLDSDRFSSLQNKYEQLAQDFIGQKEYEKAAHVYLKLLQNNFKAAQVLEEGKLYPEAATVYLKHCQNKPKAAECYENGKAYKEAIAICKELEMTEKVGDLYLLLNDKVAANEYFYKVVADYTANSQYVKASLLLRNKIGSIPEAQELLLEGWRSNKDAGTCLNNYFFNIENEKELQNAIVKVYATETSDTNLETFLMVIKKEYKKSEALQVVVKDIAYEIVAKRIDQNPQIASELLSFNKSDRNIAKDVMNYKFTTKNRK